MFVRRHIKNQPERSLSIGNAGDLLNTYLLRKLFPLAKLNPSTKGRSQKLFLIGSTIDKAEKGDVIFGAGVWYPERTNIFYKDLRVFGLRGPRTYDLLKKMGVDLKDVKFMIDPGVIAARIYESETKEQKGSNNRLLYIPHHAHRIKNIRPRIDADFFDIDCKPEDFLGAIFKSSGVLTSSLHALIIANTFGIPAVLFSNTESMFKFYDYADSVSLNLKIFAEPQLINYSDIPDSAFELKKSLTDNFEINESDLLANGVAY